MDNYADWHKQLNGIARRLYGTDEHAAYPLAEEAEAAKLRVGVAGALPKTYGVWLNALEDAHYEAHFLRQAEHGRYEEEAHVHLVVQVIRATQPVSRSDQEGYDSLKHLVPEEQYVFVADEMDGVEPEERADVCRYIEEKLGNMKPLRQPVHYISARTGEGLDSLSAFFRSLCDRKQEIIARTEKFRIVRRMEKIRHTLQREMDELLHADRRIAERKMRVRSSIRQIQRDAERMIVYLQAQKEKAESYICGLTHFGEAEWKVVTRFWNRQTDMIRTAGNMPFQRSDEKPPEILLPSDDPGSRRDDWKIRNSGYAESLQQAVKQWAYRAIEKEREGLRLLASRKPTPERIAVLTEMEQELNRLAQEVGGSWC